jgi:phosphonate transport system substrate-binding protein
VVVFQKQKDPREIRAAADKVAAELSRRIGIPVEVEIPASYSASVQALVSDRAQVAYLSAIPYLLASQEADVDIAVAEVRAGTTDYDSVFVVAKESPIRSLADLRGKRMMFTSPTSASGYVMPYARLVQEKLLAPREDPAKFFSRVGFAGGYDRALQAVANGQADVTAVSDYAIEGPKADLYGTPELRAKLRVLARTPGVPTHLLAVRADLPPDLREKLTTALLEISATQPELLADVYGAASFERVGEDHVATAERALADTGLAAKRLVE